LEISPYSQARIISGIKAFYRFLMYEDRITEDPAQLLEAPKLGRKLPDTLSYEEIETLLAAIPLGEPEGHRNRAMLEMLYSSGLRVSELVELKKSQIFAEVGFLKVVGKGNKERLVPTFVCHTPHRRRGRLACCPRNVGPRKHHHYGDLYPFGSRLPQAGAYRIPSKEVSVQIIA
jgi:integrase